MVEGQGVLQFAQAKSDPVFSKGQEITTEFRTRGFSDTAQFVDGQVSEGANT
jgi:hypothetical protein